MVELVDWGSLVPVQQAVLRELDSVRHCMGLFAWRNYTVKHPSMSELDNPAIKDPVERLQFWASEMRSWYPIFLESEAGMLLEELETILTKMKENNETA